MMSSKKCDNQNENENEIDINIFDEGKDSYEKFNIFLNDLLWVHFGIIFFALISLFYGWEYTKKFSEKYMNSRKKNKKRVKCFFYINLVENY